MADQASTIKFRDVNFVLPGGKKLLANLNLEVARGETLVLLGRSGSGKTTTMKLINRLIDPTSGQVEVEGKATVEWDPIQLRRRIGYVIQEIGLFPHLTIEQNIGVVPRLEGWEPDRIAQRARELLNLVGLDADRFAGRFPRELSGGQRVRFLRRGGALERGRSRRSCRRRPQAEPGLCLLRAPQRTVPSKRREERCEVDHVDGEADNAEVIQLDCQNIKKHNASSTRRSARK